MNQLTFDQMHWRMCTGCGSTMTDDELKRRKELPGSTLISCCPDRKMIPVYELNVSIEAAASGTARFVEETKARIERDAAVAFEQGVAEARMNEMQRNSDQWLWLIAHIRGERFGPKQEFILPRVEPITNIMQGSVAQHFNLAVDDLRARGL